MKHTRVTQRYTTLHTDETKVSLNRQTEQNIVSDLFSNRFIFQNISDLFSEFIF